MNWISIKEGLPVKKCTCGIVATLNDGEPIISLSDYDPEKGFAIEMPERHWIVSHYFEYPPFIKADTPTTQQDPAGLPGKPSIGNGMI